MRVLLSVLLAIGCFGLIQAQNESSIKRDGKFLSVFQIVRFPNNACSGSSNRNGTCFTEQECDSRGGTSQGSCANGYGVCCVFALNCGGTSSENCTYFESVGSEVGDCMVKICKSDSNICQLRLDFSTFTITGPSTSTVVNGKFNGKDITSDSKCLTDTFTALNPGGATPPSICGINTGEHMYVEASDACNNLVFQLGASGIGTGVTARQWNIKIQQYSCEYENLAPAGCTQYFYGSNTGTIMTYNQQGGHHLASQNQNICIRQERGQCRICYYTAAATDFATSGMVTNMGVAKQSSCCAYGTKGTKTLYDCVNIPGALKTATTTLFAPSNICGATLVTAAGTSAGPKTICTDRVPFQVRFLSDEFEFTGEAALVQVGFKLQYTMSSNGCS